MHHLAICQQLSILVQASLWSRATVFMDFSVVRHLFGAARYDEKECIGFFGESYREYKQRSKMFIPFIL